MAYPVGEVNDGGAGRAERPAPSRLLVPLLAGIFTVLAIAGLRLASSLLLPIAVAVFLTLLLGPVVRELRKRGVAEGLSAGLIVFGTVALLGAGLGALIGPAGEWLNRAPETLRKVEWKLRNLRPLTAIEATASSVAKATGSNDDPTAPRVMLATESPLKRVGWTTASAIAGVLTVAFLTYFLLATGAMFRRKVAHVFPDGSRRTRMKRALYEIERQMSRYLFINTMISITVGAATSIWLTIIGMPNPLLWGAVAAVLNYVPYLGALVTVALIGIVALATFDGTERVLLACGGFMGINLLESNLLTPMVLGRKMPLNAVAVFVSLLFWGWVWGITGVIMAVPLTVMIQVVCSHSERFRAIAILLGNWGASGVRTSPDAVPGRIPAPAPAPPPVSIAVPVVVPIVPVVSVPVAAGVAASQPAA